MERSLPIRLFIIFSVLLLTSCAGEDLDDLLSENYNARLSKIFIYDSDLVGQWNIKAVITDKSVDLNNDKISSTDLMKETSCFENMSYTFRGDKTFTIISSQLNMKTGEDRDVFSCMNPVTTTGKWSLKDDMLSLFVRVNGREIEQKKHVILVGDSFFLEINSYESKEFINDAGGTIASGLNIVSLEYKKSGK
ncbi:hypothetical protein BH23BAC2_BH23BAC2_25940 [soil metagenome]